MVTEEWLTVESAAELLGVTKRAIHRYVQAGKLAPYKRGIGRRTFFRREDVEALGEVRPVERPTSIASSGGPGPD